MSLIARRSRLDYLLVFLIATLSVVLLALFAARTTAIRRGWTPVAQTQTSVVANPILGGGK